MCGPIAVKIDSTLDDARVTANREDCMDKRVFRNLPPPVSGKHVDKVPSVSSSIITRLLLAFLLSQTITAMPVSSQAASLPGLSVARDGTLLRNSIPIAAWASTTRMRFCVHSGIRGDESYRDDFRKLAANHIPFARITACSFSPSEYQLYLHDKENYFKLLDGVVQTSRRL